MAGCSATGANSPGSAASSARIAAASTGVDTGRRPLPASVAAPRSSANRKVVRNVTAASPTPVPVTGPSEPADSSRRDATPRWFDGTTTVTGARGSPAFPSATAPRRAWAASSPYEVITTRNATT